YQGTQTSPNLGQNSGNTSLSILGRPFGNRGIQGEVYGKHTNILFPAYQTGIQNQLEEVEPDSFPINNSLGDGDKFQNDEPEGSQGQDQRSPSRSQQATEDGENDFEMSSELYRKSSSHVGSSSPRTPYVEKAIGSEEQRAEEFEFMDISGDAEQTRVTEPEILVPKTQEMEQEIISTGDPRAGDLYRCQRHGMGDSCGIPILFRFVVSIRSINAYKLQRIIDCIICTPAPRRCWALCVSLFRQHYDSSICQKIWGNYFSQIARSFRADMASLPENKHSSSGDICTNVHQSSGRTEQADGSDRMVSLQQNFWEIGETLRAPRHRPVCIQSKQQGTELLQLVHRRERERNECSLTLMETMEQPLLLSSMEFNHSGDSEGQERTSHTDFSDSYVEVSTVVPRPPQTSSDGTCTYTGNGDYSRPQKRKIPTDRQQKAVSISLEDHRSSLENQGYNKEAIELLLPNERVVKRRTRNNTIQQKFIDWLEVKNKASNYTTTDLINYLAELFIVNKLNVNTLKVYKSAILQRFITDKIQFDWNQWNLFIKNIEEMNIKAYKGVEIDISPMLEYFKKLGPTEELEIKTITSKACWIISICGFLRPSDIHRIDDERTIHNDLELRFIIVAPKEKQQGSPIEKLCIIKAHKDRLLCPIIAYKVYKQKVANIPCPRPHQNDNTVTINHLFRFLKDHSKPLSADSISRNVKSITKMIINKGNRLPKDRAIRATLAANAGIPADVIITQANWSGLVMFDNYYRLNRNPDINITDSIL
ncbi:hypothetical protein AYI70_g11445, partial [Smittium culicis]